MCFIKVFCERVCVPGDGGEADLAEEKRPMLNQLGMESTGKSVWGLNKFTIDEGADVPVSLVGCEVADFEVLTEQVKAQDGLIE